MEKIKFEPWKPDWTNTVLGMISNDDKINGHPRVDGLRRVAWEIFDLLSSETHVLQSPNIENGGRAVVVVDIHALKNGATIDSSGSADVFHKNCDPKFSLHATAVAETRAEGRALRKLLVLNKVLAAEELYQPKDTEELVPASAPASMIASLNLMCDKLGISVIKFANNNDILINQPSDLTKDQVLQLTNILNGYKGNESNIPKEIKR